MANEKRVVMDCRNSPESKGCTVTIAGKESEVLELGKYHAISQHGLPDNGQTLSMLKESIKEEEGVEVGSSPSFGVRESGRGPISEKSPASERKHGGSEKSPGL